MYFLITNIPTTFDVKELRIYFSYFIEREAFKCFHYCYRTADSIKNYLLENKTIYSQELNKNHLNEYEDLTSLCLEITNGIYYAGELSSAKNLIKNFTTDYTDAKEDSGGKEINAQFCCIGNVKDEVANDFKAAYDKKFWVKPTGYVFPVKCSIYNIDPLVMAHKLYSIGIASSGTEYVTNKERFSKNNEIYFNRIECMKEFRMGLEMPWGNVGTTSAFFNMQLKNCKLSPSLIKKLGLDIIPTRVKKCYSQVHLDYETSVEHGGTYPGSAVSIFTSKGDLIPGYFDIRHNQALSRALKKPTQQFMYPAFDNESSGDDIDDDVDEGDVGRPYDPERRHRETAKEKLYEHKTEQVWEKGGSGLVFYTDAIYWRIKDNESEESDVDDWDLQGDNSVDSRDMKSLNALQKMRANIASFSVFTDKFKTSAENDPQTRVQRAGKPQSRHRNLAGRLAETKGRNRFHKPDSLQRHMENVGSIFPRQVEKNIPKNAMRQLSEQSFEPYKKRRNLKRAEIKSENRKESQKLEAQSVGEFERFTKGVGRLVLESQGWTEGVGLGRKQDGILYPLNILNAKLHKDRSCLGYQRTHKNNMKRTSNSQEVLVVSPHLENRIKWSEEKSSLEPRQNISSSIAAKEKPNELLPYNTYPYKIQFQKSETLFATTSRNCVAD